MPVTPLEGACLQEVLFYERKDHYKVDEFVEESLFMLAPVPDVSILL
jgi:hypothetical protein